MHGDLLLVVLILVFGCAAFLFGLVYVVGYVLSAVGRGMWGLVRPCRGPGPTERVQRLSRPLRCSRVNCRKVEYRNARFCSQCGAPLNYE